MNINILYEDDDIVAINKPAGLVVHSDGLNRAKSTVGRTSQGEVLDKTIEPTLVDWIERLLALCLLQKPKNPLNL